YWTIYVELSELVVSTSRVDAWSEVVWAYGDGPSDVRNGFQYKEEGSTEWIDVPSSRVIQIQGAFSCSIPHLKPLTDYVVRAVSGNDKGNEVKVTTQSTADIPNGDFEDWCQIGKIIYPYAEGGDQFWDTGNTGSSTLGQNLTVPSDNTPTGSGKSAECTTKFVGFGVIGKLGAGSLFTGKFRKVDGTNGILDFGQPWTLRPTKLKGYYQYKGKDIDYASTELAELKGRPDTCIVYVALTDWTAPYEIRTNPKNRILFDKDASYVIGYGQMQFSGTMDAYKEFEIDIKYRDTSKVPSYLQITCATSKYGDYFTGGNGSVLWVDQFSFGWDLE
ncbi:MAG: PCMD domain-containing protein, partial [Muribaculaceae bacterium]|nr:PCMD domain-containing protein [Muribaculaceae bacterium]